MTHEKEIEVRWRDLDVYGHVNHVVFLTYLEEARDEWLGRALGDPGEIWNYVVARVAIDYRREISLADDVVVARCRLGRIGNSSIRTVEQVATRSGEIAADAEAVLVARDPASGRSRPLTSKEREALARVAGG
ncbi:MAG TPA: thioesterase family protein [Gaiellaceae bacterium]|nr:thioesterase family protein [Gaiellaceae bacterium]